MAEVERRLNEWDRRISGQVSRELYERDRQEMKDDLSDIQQSIRELKDASTWATRLIIGQFLALLVGLLMFLLGNP